MDFNFLVILPAIISLIGVGISVVKSDTLDGNIARSIVNCNKAIYSYLQNENNRFAEKITYLLNLTFNEFIRNLTVTDKNSLSIKDFEIKELTNKIEYIVVDKLIKATEQKIKLEGFRQRIFFYRMIFFVFLIVSIIPIPQMFIKTIYISNETLEVIFSFYLSALIIFLYEKILLNKLIADVGVEHGIQI
ncbi:MAG: hypothetical protein IPH62_16450 [Ignavibacteriae bacterium]|nr:hypothetical protein [Ignavibacteriota bacterium]